MTNTRTVETVVDPTGFPPVLGAGGRVFESRRPDHPDQWVSSISSEHFDSQDRAAFRLCGLRLPPEAPLTSRRDSYGDRLWRRRAMIAAVLSVLSAVPASAQPVPESPGVVARERVTVVDGDSIALDGREWRLRGFDTPEIEKAGCEGERRLALAAKQRLEALVDAAREIRVDGGQEADRYKRPLGDLVLDGVNVREVMIGELWARPYNGGRRKGWCSRDSIDTLVPGDPPLRRKGG